MKKGQSGLKIVVILLGVIVFVGIIATILIANNPNLTGNVVKAFQNCRDVQVPHEEIEEYIDNVPYTADECKDVELKFVNEWGSTDTICLNEICDNNEQYCVEYGLRNGACKKWNWLGTVCTEYYQVQGDCIKFTERCIHKACTKYRMDCTVKINNIDNEAGTWGIDGYFWNRELNQKGDFIKTVSTYVNPTRTNTASWSFTYNAGEDKSCWYTISTVPTKQVCEKVIKYKDVVKTRTITKYKTEEQCD